MKRILFLLLLGMAMFGGQAFGGTILFLQSSDANPTPNTQWSGNTAFTVCNSQQRSFRVQYSYSSHQSCYPNRYRVTIKLLLNGNVVTSNTGVFSGTFFDLTIPNVTVVPGTWTAEGTLERLPCCCAWYTAETITSSAFTVTNFCQVIITCLPNITISGTYTTFLTQASSSIKTANTTIIPNGADVRLDANDNTNNGFIDLNPGFETQNNSVFVAQALDGCGPGTPAKPAPESITEKLDAGIWRAFPNPTTGIITVQHPADVPALYVYGIDGKLYQTIDANTNGETKLDIAALPPGMYLIRANGQNPIKVTKQ